MRSLLKPVAGLVCLVALACAGCSSSGGGGSSDSGADGSSQAAASPQQLSTGFQPYVSAITASGLDDDGSPSTYNLAFVLSSGSGCTPKWNGDYAIGNQAVRSRISALKDSGASVRVSFGGATGTELAPTCDSVADLAKAYGAALDAAGSTQADFDIEGTALTDTASIDLRSKSIALLQKQRPKLKVSFTLPAMPTGLTDDAVAVLDSANDNGVMVSTVNIMAMTYGTSYTGDMGDYALAAAKAAHDQLTDVFGLTAAGAWRGLAVTVMIGDNDVEGETFTLADAAKVRTLGTGKDLAWVSMWATFRDQQCDSGSSSGAATSECSGVSQQDGAFAKALAG
ncbi:chitinase [Streptomyces sp. CA-142005]|uniref:chitinase n=1 Tax=Streptomyces sp. CA-142005 TaxID=3240052 RepID=UPI003D92BC34